MATGSYMTPTYSRSQTVTDRAEIQPMVSHPTIQILDIILRKDVRHGLYQESENQVDPLNTCDEKQDD
ncbi:hypothetical protein TNCV_4789901 [Trichonephila clavipes]|nr:hypothetical protein TNCV_4789901 [Trichonephila clavipes]